MLLHTVERSIAALDLFRVELGDVLAEIDDLEAAHRDVGLVAVLLPEQPFVHLGRREGVGRDQRAVAGEIADDGVGLRQCAAVVECDGRHLAGAVHGEELRRARLALASVDLNPLVRQREPVADPLHLETISGIAVAVYLHRCCPVGTTQHQGRLDLSIGAMRTRQNL